MIRIVADDKISFLKGAFEPFADIIYLPWSAINKDSIINADALLIRSVTKCDHNLLNETSIKFIGTATVGLDHIDTNYCKDHSIHWVNAPGCNAASVQQYICAALLTIAENSGFSLQDQTLGIIGVGNIGSHVEKLAKLMGMNVLLNDPPRERNEGHEAFETFHHLLEASDILTLHVPLNISGQDKTWHLMNRDSMRKMKPNTWLINSARGEVIDTVALKEAISIDTFSGLVLDVWENEPRIDLDLLPYVFLATPHIAGYSAEGKANGTAIVVRELGRFFNLPLEKWFPSDIPEPDNPVLIIDGENKTSEEIVREAVKQTYSILEDDRTFRADPRTFEQQRGNYPIRREFSAYQISLKNTSPDATELLKNIGFSVDQMK